MSHSDPRAVRSRRMIRRAALDELAASGYAGFTVESVAARAGVGRSTVYRHWPDQLSLIGDALETLNEQPARVATAASPRARVAELLLHLVQALADSPVGRCLPALVHAADQDATVGVFHHGYSARRRQALVAAVTAGMESGDFPPRDPELAATALAGAIFYRRLMTAEPLAAAEVPPLIDTVLG